jgi:arginyl-tRNA synthetase
MSQEKIIHSLQYSTTIDLVRKKIKQSLISNYRDIIGENPETMVFPAKSEYGDYQSNAAMPLAKKLKLKPKDIAEKLIQSISTENNLISKVDISGPGFINIHLSEKYIKEKLIQKLKSPSRLAIPMVENPQKIIIDFSSPNIAKEMHVVKLFFFLFFFFFLYKKKI